jgi:hypothetical protein
MQALPFTVRNLAVYLTAGHAYVQGLGPVQRSVLVTEEASDRLVLLFHYVSLYFTCL